MSATAPGAGSRSGAEGRPADLRVARVHLRNGALGLARAELEAAAGRGSLDEDALLDLAEARWRTGDLAGAGEVANAYLATGRRDPLAFVVAAEAVAALGRPSEARRLAASAVAERGQDLDTIFAGMPRSHIWPGEVGGATAVTTTGRGEQAGDLLQGEGQAAATSIRPTSAASAEAASVSDAAAALDDGRRALSEGDTRTAALRLGVALRLDPRLAPAVLDAVHPAAPAPELALLRGDALRVLGRESEARAAFAAAVRGAEGRGRELGDAPDAVGAPQPPGPGS